MPQQQPLEVLSPDLQLLPQKPLPQETAFRPMTSGQKAKARRDAESANRQKINITKILIAIFILEPSLFLRLLLFSRGRVPQASNHIVHGYDLLSHLPQGRRHTERSILFQ